MCPEAGLGGPECCLRISLLPLRLNIDQVTLTELEFLSLHTNSYCNLVSVYMIPKKWFHIKIENVNGYVSCPCEQSELAINNSNRTGSD